jgi:hypothetical protein
MKALFKEFYRLGRIADRGYDAHAIFMFLNGCYPYNELTRHARTNLYNLFYSCR